MSEDNRIVFKHIRVQEDTHKEVKIFAANMGMTLDECVLYMLRIAKKK